MNIEFLSESLEIAELNKYSLENLSVGSWQKKKFADMKKTPLTQRDMDSYYAKRIARMGKRVKTALKCSSSMCLTNGESGIIAIMDFGIAYAYSEIGFTPTNSQVIARNCIRFESYDGMNNVGLFFIMDPIFDLNSKESKASSKRAKTVIKTLSKATDYQGMRKLFQIESTKDSRYRYSW